MTGVHVERESLDMDSDYAQTEAGIPVPTEGQTKERVPRMVLSAPASEPLPRTPSCISKLQKVKTTTLLMLQPVCVWPFVAATTGDRYTWHWTYLPDGDFSLCKLCHSLPVIQPNVKITQGSRSLFLPTQLGFWNASISEVFLTGLSFTLLRKQPRNLNSHPPERGSIGA